MDYSGIGKLGKVADNAAQELHMVMTYIIHNVSVEVLVFVAPYSSVWYPYHTYDPYIPSKKRKSLSI